MLSFQAFAESTTFTSTLLDSLRRKVQGRLMAITPPAQPVNITVEQLPDIIVDDMDAGTDTIAGNIAIARSTQSREMTLVIRVPAKPGFGTSVHVTVPEAEAYLAYLKTHPLK